MPKDEYIPYQHYLPEDAPLPYEDRFGLSEQVEKDPIGAWAFIWMLKMEVSLLEAKLRATKDKLNEVVSAQIGYLDR